MLSVKMPSEQARNNASVLPTPTEKPFHYTYLKEFRTQQCPDFLQHKCQNHRPFTCFHWHFMNQRRRRPIRKRDGTFNYNPDIYCSRYDETTGICPDGDDCLYLHRPAGDVERRYHLRYYKTGICVHETDSRGHCVKNGPHCAFAHGPHDLRPPVYDIRELLAIQEGGSQPATDNNNVNVPVTTVVEKEKNAVNDVDPKWQDTNYVLANYKTEPCKRPPRLCRQGYACPQYHNTRDRRRSPRKSKYRSTPCPNVKHSDEWGETTNCEQGDACLYCHTRTEQQFHPEIYKSTKCNDMQQTGYCPRGPFCAFAHVEQEMMTIKEYSEEGSIPGVVSPTTTVIPFTMPIGQQMTSATLATIASTSSENPAMVTYSPVPGPIAKPRSNSTSSNFSSESASYMKAPGSEREDTHQANLRRHLLLIENDPGIDEQEKARRKQNLLMAHSMSGGSPLTSSIASTPPTPSSLSQVSPMAPPFYPASDTVESVVGNALEDLNLDDFDVHHVLDKELDNDTASIGSSGAGMSGSSTGIGILGSSAPVNIPGTTNSSSTNSNINNQQVSHSGSTGSSPLSQLPPPFVPQHLQKQQQQQQQLEQAQAAFMSQPNPAPTAMNQLGFGSILDPLGNPASPNTRHSIPQSPGTIPNQEAQRLPEESILKGKVHGWEESWNQGKPGSIEGSDYWKREISEQPSDIEKHDKDEAVSQAIPLRQESQSVSHASHLHVLQTVAELHNLPLSQLKQLQARLRNDLARVDRVVYMQETFRCLVCTERYRSISVLPCQHFVLCDQCAVNRRVCPYCETQITQQTTVLLPL
ncbi:RING finger protein unkempt-like [Ptychodera flava]|uniref:RING finger protein unkempt-like n=1 Tax=Ptychodera flava TaxID=63121 RepID=UPI003969D99E